LPSSITKAKHLALRKSLNSSYSAFSDCDVDDLGVEEGVFVEDLGVIDGCITNVGFGFGFGGNVGSGIVFGYSSDLSPDGQSNSRCASSDSAGYQ